MKIAYYMPFKPLGHPNPSGDLIIGSELYNHFASSGHSIELISRLRCRWIYYKPWKLLNLLKEKKRISNHLHDDMPDIWLSYHSYYKAPDLLGSKISKNLQIPYVIFQGIYSTKRRKKLKTLPGFLLNRAVLLVADHIFTNKKRDYKNLQRLLPPNRLSFIPPGIQPAHFTYSDSSRQQLRKRWNVTDEIVVITAAMMRPGVKTEGIKAVIKACATLSKDLLPLKLVIAGDGSNKSQLEQYAKKLLPGRSLFLGKIDRQELYHYFSGSDIFAFPGVNEALGMVYLEAQSCSLPVVALQDWGGGEAVIDGQTGLLSPAKSPDLFMKNLQILIENRQLRLKLGGQAKQHIRLNHDLVKNYKLVEETLFTLSSGMQK